VNQLGRLVVLLLIVAVPATSTPRVESAPATDPLVEQILGAALSRAGAMAFLETLTDTVGPRVTGSPQSRQAAELILRTLKDAGLDNVHFEEFAIETGWNRGRVSVRVVSPVQQTIVAGSYGWVPGTNGAIEAPVTEVTVAADGRFSRDPSTLSGSAVIVHIQSGDAFTYGSNYVVARTAIARQLAQAGAAAMLIPSDKPNRMLYTSAFGFYPRGGLPVLSIGAEDAQLLHRLVAKGAARVSLDVQNSFDTRPPMERNVVADLAGTQPNEMVLVGAHFDSWDLAQGANDNGSGVAAILDAARVLKSLNARPRATIRFVFFSGEEQALIGSRAYVEAHRQELDGLRAMLVMDGGAQAPLGFSVLGRTDLEEPTRAAIAALRAIGAGGIDPRGELASDHETFLVAGVPTLSLWVDEGEYDTHHHAVTDTLEKINPRWLALDSAAMAIAAYSLANAETRPAPRLTTSEVRELLKRTGVLGAVELIFGPNWDKQRSN
jgi:Iap family predicted aminopeptidase